MGNQKKAEDAQVISAYEEFGSLKKAAAALGLCPQTVHERLHRLNVATPPKIREWSADELNTIRQRYNEFAEVGKLTELAILLNRTYGTLTSKACDMGLGKANRLKPWFLAFPNEQAARSMFDRFKRSRLTLGRFCKLVGVSDDVFLKRIRDRWPDEWESVIESKAPLQTKYRLGRQFEYRVRDIFRAADYFVLRSPGSKSEVDLVAVKPGRVCFIQCKRGGCWVSREWNSFFLLSKSVGAIPIFAEMPGLRGTILWEMIGLKDGKKSPQPRVSFTP